MKDLVKNNFLSLIESKKQSWGNKNVGKNLKVWVRIYPVQKKLDALLLRNSRVNSKSGHKPVVFFANIEVFTVFYCQRCSYLHS
jgi:hypothetical protein